jgi:hypothetical protein
MRTARRVLPPGHDGGTGASWRAVAPEGATQGLEGGRRGRAAVAAQDYTRSPSRPVMVALSRSRFIIAM